MTRGGDWNAQITHRERAPGATRPVCKSWVVFHYVTGEVHSGFVVVDVESRCKWEDQYMILIDLRAFGEGLKHKTVSSANCKWWTYHWSLWPIPSRRLFCTEFRMSPLMVSTAMMNKSGESGQTCFSPWKVQKKFPPMSLMRVAEWEEARQPRIQSNQTCEKPRAWRQSSKNPSSKCQKLS